MKNELVRTAIAMMMSCTLLLTLSCSRGEEQSANVTPLGNPCDESNIDKKIEKLNERILADIKGNRKLRSQYESQRFRFEVKKVGNSYAEVFITGKVSGEGTLEALVDIFDNFEKSKCVMKITMSPTDPAHSSDPVTTSAPGFEWQLCEYPLVACPNGECLSSCP